MLISGRLSGLPFRSTTVAHGRPSRLKLDAQLARLDWKISPVFFS